MASASLIPDHLTSSKGKSLSESEKIANCFMIVNQALRWGIDPFSMAPETYVVGGKLAFQGKLVAAIVNGIANLDERLSYTFMGKGDDLTITVSGRIRSEATARTVTVRVGDVKTDNQMWKKDPEQKLVYNGAVKWARRHTPEVILGILVDDEASDVTEVRDVTPRPKLRVVSGKGVAENTTANSKANVAEATHEAEQEHAQAMPERKEMTSAIRIAFRGAGMSLVEAQERAVAHGAIKAGETFSGLDDIGMHSVFERISELYPAVEGAEA